MNRTVNALDQWWGSRSETEQAMLQQELNRQLQELNPAAPPLGQLSARPLLLSPDQWHPLQRGLAQRHRLLNLVLADLYGEQQLLRQGLLPAAELLSSPLFLLPCHQLQQSNKPWLSLFSIELGSTSDGRFFVRQQHSSPLGLGLVVQHRLAMNQLQLPGKHLPKRLHLAQFFRDLKQLLHDTENNQAQGGLLCAGKADPFYAELNFLAGYLDLPLLQSADLMFKDGALHLKTVTGLKPLHALLCALPDAERDALELNHSGLGPAGLVQSIRQQQLQMINPPGASLVQHPLLQVFLPQLCRHLLGEELLLPALPCYWGGQHELPSRLEPGCQLYQISSHRLLHWSELDSTAQQAWREQLQLQSADFVLFQSQPGTEGDAPLSLQLFSLDQQGHISVLPGALAQQQGQADSPLYRDVWFAGQSADQQSLWRPGRQHVRLNRSSGVLPSRIADHLFWLGRYNERLNLMSRVVRQLVQMAVLEQSLATADSRALLQFCLFANGATALTAPKQAANWLQHGLAQLCSPTAPGSLPKALSAVLYNTMSVREYISEDSWYVLEQLQRQSWSAETQWQPAALVRQLDQLLLLQTAIYGMNNETMTRTPGLNFLQAGQHLERALQMSHLLQSCFCQPQSISASLQEALLRLTDTQVTYRRRYGSELHPLAVLDLLLLDDSTPRSVCFGVSQLEGLLSLLPSNDGQNSHSLALLQQLKSFFGLEADVLLTAEQQASPGLKSMLFELQQLLRQLSEQITHSYFSHAEPSWRWQQW
ncbi:circularly permuted type 2 ATP-grasp protein [Rheinheimera sp.]|uniref:circularly permuted type 2 ATP-grasp protein n=1 Tax=Rheinheimera sp. TaxID=1869214 RepID=UPI00307CE9BB